MEATELMAPAFWDEGEARVLAPCRLQVEGKRLESAIHRSGEDRNWVVFASSGSTGAPKWVALQVEALRCSARAVNTHLAVTTADSWLLALPVFHVGGFGVVARAREAGCAFAEFRGDWDPGAFASTLEETKATLSSLVPAQVHDLVEGGIFKRGP